MVCPERFPQGCLSVVTEILGITVHGFLHSRTRTPSEHKGRKTFDKRQLKLEEIRKQDL